MSEIIRDSIEGELNRIAVTDDSEEVIKMLGYLQLNISKYARANFDRIRDKRLKQLKKVEKQIKEQKNDHNGVN